MNGPRLLRLSLVAAFMCGLALPSSAGAKGVAFLNEEAVRVATTNKPKTVFVFNGSSQRRTLSLRLLRRKNGEIVIRPTRASTPAGATTRFRLIVKTLPDTPADRTLLATSTDGSSARRDVRLGAADPEVPAIPKAIDFGVSDAFCRRVIPKGIDFVSDLICPAEELELDGVRAEPEIVGTLYGDNREHVDVTAEEGALVVDPPKPGKYTGQIDLAPGREGGEAEVTLHVRHPWYVVIVVLIIGILLGLVVEFWLTRWRPEALLDRRLKRLLDRVERRQIRVNRALRKRYEAAYPDQGATPPAMTSQGWIPGGWSHRPTCRTIRTSGGPISRAQGATCSARCATRPPTPNVRCSAPTATSSRRC